MLTNFSTISGRVKKMQEYQRMRASGDFEAMPKKEALLISRELEKLERNLGGIRNMTKLPDAVFIIDTKKEHIGVVEANKLKLPVVAVVDTNCDPDLIDYVIPGNDDAIRSGTLMCRIISDAVREGRFIGERKGTVKAIEQLPTPEEEAERGRRQAEARAAAARQAAEREARIAASAQQNPEREVPVHAGEAPPSDVLEPAPGAIPARAEDEVAAARFPGTQPGAAAHAAPGSHASGDTGVEGVGHETAGEDEPVGGREVGSGTSDAGDPTLPLTDDTEQRDG
jgi:small subunit ribosomal protein S2